MIESEEKRKRLTDAIEHWCKHTKVEHLLRNGDIYGLVNRIIEEFYHITLCCGHYVSKMNEGIDLTFKEYDDPKDNTEVSGIYCKDCAPKYKKDGAWETKSK